MGVGKDHKKARGIIITVIGILLLVAAITMIVAAVKQFSQANAQYKADYNRWYDRWWNEHTADLNDKPDIPHFKWYGIVGALFVPFGIFVVVLGVVLTKEPSKTTLPTIDLGAVIPQTNTSSNCVYCGGLMGANDKKCPHCGGAISKKR